MRLGSFSMDDMLRGRRAGIALRAADVANQAALRNYRLFLGAARTPTGLMDHLSPLAALRAAEQARRRVPAYQTLLARSGWRDDPALSPAARMRLLPTMDKASYVKAFSTEERCLDGRIRMTGTTIDESSGSSGTPFNWVRSSAELRDVHRKFSQFGWYFFGHDVITINGFSMGAWATGVNAGEAMRRNGVVKSTGPDLEKILRTLEFFGPKYPYVITGYPPFLKHLVDESEKRGFDWQRYRIYGVAGGEGMSEGLRAYLERRFITVYSGYGASDIDIGVAGEMPITVWIRKRVAENPALQRALFGDDPRLPMLFQYSPLDYYIETNEAGELIITVNRLKVLSPRIRYNIHDAGGVIPFARMLAVLREFRLDPLPECDRAEQPVFPIPFLYLFGRSDSTVSYMGANIYPEDIEQALYAESEDARWLGAFCLELLDLGEGEQRVCIHVEVLDGVTDDVAFADRLRERVLNRLLATNLDFRSSVDEDPSAREIIVRLHAEGQGPFAMNNGRIKRRYIVPSAGATAPELAAGRT
jgi:phenylacetate-CoA ligase